MRIVVENAVTARIESPGQSLQQELAKALRFRPKGYNFVAAYKRGYWDGFISLLKQRQGGGPPAGSLEMPTGLIPHVLELLGPQNASRIEIVPRPYKWSTGVYANAKHVDLHEVQESAVSAAIMKGRGIVQYPTGVGKGRIMGQIIARLNMPALVLVDKTDLLTQLAKEIEPSIGETVGRIGGGSWVFNTCTIATVQSLIKEPAEKLRRTLASFPVVFVDEAHHAEADTFQTILNLMPDTPYRFGMSATAFRSYKGKSDSLSTYLKVQAVLGPPIASLTIEEGIETGRIVRPDIFMVRGIPGPDLVSHRRASGTPPGPLNWKDEYKWGITLNEPRNLLICNMAKHLVGQKVIIVDRTDHGELLNSVLGASFVQGSTPRYIRENVYNKFRAGEIKTLIVSKLANEALDLPNINHVILAAGGKADHIQIQRIGRGMRAVEGKAHVNIWDFYDEGKYLRSHAKKRYRVYDSEPAYNLADIDASDLRDILKASRLNGIGIDLNDPLHMKVYGSV